MNRFLTALAIAFLFSTLEASAQSQKTSLDTSGLTEEQVRVLNSAITELRKTPDNTLANLSLNNLTPDRITEWANAGEGAGKAVANFTREIGIGADAFLKTDVGRTTYYAFLWKFGGDKVIQSTLNAVLDLLTGAVLLTIWWKLTRRFVFNERRNLNVVYNEKPFLRWIGFNKKESSWVKDDDWIQKFEKADQVGYVVISRVISAVLFVIIMMTCWPSVSF